MLDACKRAKNQAHTHGSTLAMRGVPMGVIAEQLGHADTRMTEKHYAHLAPSYVADTMRAHFPTLGIAEESAVTSLRGKHPRIRRAHAQSLLKGFAVATAVFGSALLLWVQYNLARARCRLDKLHKTY
jgi:hypothetical protein